jgi:hypothetical protein
MLTVTGLQILRAALAETTRLLQLAATWKRDPRSRPNPRDAAGLNLIQDVEQAHSIGVRFDVTWLGRGTGNTATKAGNRALARLEAAGLIVRRSATGRLLTHLQLTNAGEEAALASANRERAPSGPDTAA